MYSKACKGNVHSLVLHKPQIWNVWLNYIFTVSCTTVTESVASQRADVGANSMASLSADVGACRADVGASRMASQSADGGASCMAIQSADGMTSRVASTLSWRSRGHVLTTGLSSRPS